MAKLVFIDDNIIDHRIFQYMAEKYDSSTVVTYSMQPDNVIEYLSKNKSNYQLLPDAILVDLQMPGFNGYDFLKSYSELMDCLHKEINIYIVSFSLRPKDVYLTKLYPFVKQYFPKPLTEDHMKKILTLA